MAYKGIRMTNINPTYEGDSYIERIMEKVDSNKKFIRLKSDDPIFKGMKVKKIIVTKWLI